jgi:hypothetical protein
MNKNMRTTAFSRLSYHTALSGGPLQGAFLTLPVKNTSTALIQDEASLLLTSGQKVLTLKEAMQICIRRKQANSK